MDELPYSKVMFRDLHFGNEVHTLIDSLFFIWMAVDEKALSRYGRVGNEVLAVTKDREQKKYKGDGLSEMFEAMVSFGSNKKKQESPHAIVVNICRRVQYQPSKEIADEFSDLLDSLFGDDDDWRDNKNLDFAIDAEDVLKLHKVAVWTVRQLEIIAEEIVAVSPFDIGTRDVLANARKAVYANARMLEDYALNPANFREELGDQHFCPDAVVRDFWTELGARSRESRHHPIDTQAETLPAFMHAAGVIKKAVATHHSVGTLTLLERAATQRLNNGLELVTSQWATAFDGYFHLGPTLRLLRLTDTSLAAVEEWLARDESKVTDDHVKAYANEVREAFAAYRKAAAKLEAHFKSIDAKK